MKNKYLHTQLFFTLFFLFIILTQYGWAQTTSLRLLFHSSVSWDYHHPSFSDYWGLWYPMFLEVGTDTVTLNSSDGIVFIGSTMLRVIRFTPAYIDTIVYGERGSARHYSTSTDINLKDGTTNFILTIDSQISGSPPQMHLQFDGMPVGANYLYNYNVQFPDQLVQLFEGGVQGADTWSGLATCSHQSEMGSGQTNGWTISDWEYPSGIFARKNYIRTGSLDYGCVTRVQTLGITAPFTENTTIELFGNSPNILSTQAKYRSTFLRNVSVPNTFTTTIDWKNAPQSGRRVHYKLNGHEQIDDVADDIVTKTYDMGTDPNIIIGHNVLTVSSSSLFGTSSETTYEFDVVALPVWALPASDYTATSQGEVITYNKKSPTQWPLTPFAPSRQLRDVPILRNRTLGLQDSYLKIGVSTTSLGAEFDDPITLFSGVRFGETVSNYEKTSSDFSHSSLTPTTLKTHGIVRTPLYQINADMFSEVIQDVFPTMTNYPRVTKAVTWLIEKIIDFKISRTLSAQLSNATFSDESDNLKWNDGNGYASALYSTSHPFSFLSGAVVFNLTGEGHAKVAYTLPELNPKLSYGLNFKLDAYVIREAWGGRIGEFSIAEYTEGLRGEDSSYTFSKKQSLSDPHIQSVQPFVGNIRQNAHPVIASGRNKQKATVWCGTGTDTHDASGDINCRLFDGSSWSNIIHVTDDVRFDQTPFCAYDGKGDLIITWEHNDILPIPNTIDSLDNFLPSTEIEYAILNASTGVIKKQGAITKNNLFDFSPRLCTGEDGSVLCVWISNDGKTIFGEKEHPNSFYASEWNGSVWTTPKIIASGLLNVFDFDASMYQKNKAMLVYVRDADDTLVTKQDRGIYIVEKDSTGWKEPKNISSSDAIDLAPRTTYTIDGTSFICWMRNNQVVGTTNYSAQQSHLLLRDSSLDAGTFLSANLVSSEQSLKLIWSDTKNLYTSTADLSDVFHFSKPDKIFSSDVFIQNNSSALDMDGNLSTLATQTTSDSNSIADLLLINNQYLPMNLAVTLQSPDNDTTSVPLSRELLWQSTPAALSYQVQLSQRADFSSLLIDQNGITETSFPFSSLSNNETYYWRVRSIDANGTNPWSVTWRFKTIYNVVPPQAPQLISPVNDSLNVPLSAYLVWSPSVDATDYQIQFSNDQNFTTTIVDQSGLNQTSFHIDGLISNTKYYWRVRSANAAGNSVWSSQWMFATKSITDAITENNNSPIGCELMQNYPNPMRSSGSTTIEYSILKRSHVLLEVFNLLGVRVMTLVNDQNDVGVYKTTWNSIGSESGIYLCRLSVNGFTDTKKIVVLK